MSEGRKFMPTSIILDEQSKKNLDKIAERMGFRGKSDTVRFLAAYFANRPVIQEASP